MDDRNPQPRDDPLDLHDEAAASPVPGSHLVGNLLWTLLLAWTATVILGAGIFVSEIPAGTLESAGPRCRLRLHSRHRDGRDRGETAQQPVEKPRRANSGTPAAHLCPFKLQRFSRNRLQFA